MKGVIYLFVRLFALALLAVVLMRDARAGQFLELNYVGNFNGLAATGVIDFEDNRLPDGSANWGFYNLAGHVVWKQVAPSGGGVKVTGYIDTPFVHYVLSGGLVTGAGASTLVTIVPNDGASSYQGRVDLTTNANFVYLDSVKVTPN